MRIELTDTIDVPYEVSTDITEEGNIIRISPQSANTNRDADYDICLDKYGVQELIRTLQFLAGEI